MKTTSPETFDALLERAKTLLPTAERFPGALYDGSRTKPERVAERVAYHGRREFTVDEIRRGKADETLVSTYHERAGVDYWYTYEKDHG